LKFEWTIKTRENDASFENPYPKREWECRDQISELVKDIRFCSDKVISVSANDLVISIEIKGMNKDELNEFLIKCIQPYYANGYLKGETLKNI